MMKHKQSAAQCLEIRNALGLTQGELAAKMGVLRLTVNRWENGHVEPSPLAKQRLKDLLQEHLKKLMNDSGPTT